MKTVDVDFIQRLKMSNMLSQQEGPLGKIAPMMRVLEKIRFSDEEEGQIVKTQVDNNRISFTPPSADWGKKSVDVEDADAAALVELMDRYEHFTVQDYTWAEAFRKALKA